jgi:hypothetical protein
MMPRPQCPRCGTVVPLVGPGVQVIRCAGCGAALQVSARPVEQPRTPSASAPPVPAEPVARPRRRPMVELSSPKQRPEPESPPITFTVELSQTDIETGELEGQPASPPATPAPAPAPAPAALPTLVDTPWYAEDIERLPDASMSLAQLTLEDLASLPPLPLRLDIPPGSRTGTAPARPPGGPPSHLQGK